ncbi:MAG TPA: ATP-binding protein [Bryobacteraceae bacterium]|nr:ATP-binding protein [Bryobacteraceae bacterium]
MDLSTILRGWLRHSLNAILAPLLLLCAQGLAAQGSEPIRVGFGNMPPMIQARPDGQPVGFAVDAIEEAARREGIALTWVPSGEVADNDAALLSGDLDLIVTGIATPARRRLFFVSEPWWSSEIVAIVPALSSIRLESHLEGKRLAVPANLSLIVGSLYGTASVVPRRSAVDAAEAACSGEADAALFAGMFIRELLFAGSSACRDVGLRALNSRAAIDYVLVARHGAAEPARALRTRLDEITADGTLAAIASRHPPVSTPQATRMAETLRMGYARSVWRIGLAAGLVVILLGAAFLVRLQRSRRRLKAAKARLEQEVSALTRTEAALRDSEARVRALVDAAPQTVLAVDHSGVIVFANVRAEDMFGHDQRELIGMNAEALVPERSRAVYEQHRSSFFSMPRPRTHRSGRDLAGLHKSGAEFPIELSLGYAEMDGRGVALAFISDISERAALEQQLRQAQKMEAVGQLAGGVAHDFNNLLTVITGYAEMLKTDVAVIPEARLQVEEISAAAASAASLTRQLLAFSRRQPSFPRTIGVNDAVARMESIVRRLIGEQVSLVLAPHSGAGHVHIDPGHIEQIVLNLAVNGRDAMPGGGRLTIETGTIEVDEVFAAMHVNLHPGTYSTIIVTDSGTGIPEDLREHIFEPFFTTKAPGEGTGLGLATVYGIVRQAGGAIELNSQVGRGTSFKIYLPTVPPESASAPEESAPACAKGTETVLLVEDEAGVRSFVRHLLETSGYRVIEAPTGEHALQIATETTDAIDLLLTDVVMPGMNGVELSREIQTARPGIRVIYMSGYTGTALAVRDGLDGSFLQKPFTSNTLLSQIRNALDR